MEVEMIKRTLVAAFAFAMTLGALAQASRPPGPGGPPGEDRRDTVRLFLVHKMRERLGLSDAQTLKILDVLEAIDTQRAADQDMRRSALDRIESLLADPASPEPAYKEAVAQFERAAEQSEANMRDLEAKLLATMTPKQQAQFILLRRQLLQEIRQETARPRGQGRGRFRQ